MQRKNTYYNILKDLHKEEQGPEFLYDYDYSTGKELYATPKNKQLYKGWLKDIRSFKKEQFAGGNSGNSGNSGKNTNSNRGTGRKRYVPDDNEDDDTGDWDVEHAKPVDILNDFKNLFSSKRKRTYRKKSSKRTKSVGRTRQKRNRKSVRKSVRKSSV